MKDFEVATLAFSRGEEALPRRTRSMGTTVTVSAHHARMRLVGPPRGSRPDRGRSMACLSGWIGGLGPPRLACIGDSHGPGAPGIRRSRLVPLIGAYFVVSAHAFVLQGFPWPAEGRGRERTRCVRAAQHSHAAYAFSLGKLFSLSENAV